MVLVLLKKDENDINEDITEQRKTKETSRGVRSVMHFSGKKVLVNTRWWITVLTLVILLYLLYFLQQ